MMKRAAAIWLLTGLLLIPLELLAAEEASHVVSSLSFEITGITRERALRSFLSIKPPLREGIELPTAEALAALLERKRQDLVNDRVFKSVEIRDVVGETVDGKTEHAVTVVVVDAFSLFSLPYPSYDSNEGLELGVETHYDNGLGTMTNWYLDMYLVVRERDDAWGVGPWKVHPRISSLVIGGLPFTLDTYFERQENDRIDQGVLVADWACYKANANMSTTFNFPGNWYFKPSVTAYSNFGFQDLLEGGSDFNRDILGLSFSGSAGVGRVNWVGNLRSGLDANLGGSVSILDRDDVLGATGEVGATLSWYLPWRILDYYGRLHAQYSINDEPTVGSWLRGVANSSMGGVAGAFLNQTLAIDVIPWKRVLDLQLHPFFDVGIVAPGSRPFDLPSDLRAGTGLEAVLFLPFISNFMLRCTLGIDIASEAPFENMEVIMATGFTY